MTTRKDFIMAKKTNKKHTAWLVSNCNQTRGSIHRWEYGKSLAKAGLKLDGFGKCFGNIIDSLIGDAQLETVLKFLEFSLYKQFWNCKKKATSSISRLKTRFTVLIIFPKNSGGIRSQL